MKACIFDLDGTLTNTLESMTYSVNLTLKEMGLSQITKDQCRMFVGNGARVLIEESLKVSGDPKASRIEEGMKIYGRIFDQNCTYHVTLYEGIPEMLKALKDRGIHLAVLSNKPDRQTVKVVKEIFGDNIFDYAQGQKDGIRRKPEPDGVWYLMEQMQVSKEECLYIGDSEVDAATGKNAGLKTIGVLWGFRDRKRLRCMYEYDEECLKTFILNQGQLFDEPVAETLEEAEAFLEDCMASIVDSIEEVKEFLDQEGMDISGMSDEEIEEASEVFALPDGRYLIVEG